MASIYVLDYDADITYVLCKWFSLHGFITKGFSEAEELFNQLKERHPNIIIMDCLYGGLQETTAICNQLRNVFHFKGKMLLTSTSIFSEKYLQECNASCYIAKPFDLLDILNKVNKYLNIPPS